MLDSQLIKSFKKILQKKSNTWRYIHALFSSCSATVKLLLSSLTRIKKIQFLPRETPSEGPINPKKTLTPKATTCHLVPWNVFLQPNAKLGGKIRFSLNWTGFAHPVPCCCNSLYYKISEDRLGWFLYSLSKELIHYALTYLLAILYQYIQFNLN